MTIIQSAFASAKMPLKGALHVHTTRSDGEGSPEEVLRLYASKGYDFVALTDHNLYNHHNFAPETGLLIIPGVERNQSMTDEKPGQVHTFHTVCLGHSKERGNTWQQDQRFDRAVRVADQHALQPYLDDMHASGQITVLCHPMWSGTPAREFSKLRGHFAMEIWNSGCAIENEMDSNAAYWDEILSQGIRWWGVAVDDGHAMNHHGNGWVSVSADKTIDGVIDALEDGAFYSSCGPEIYDFRVESGAARIECSPCACAGFAFSHRPNVLTWDREAAGVTCAVFNIPEGMPYVRGIVKDANGRRAWTNPIFLNN
ncbi:phosphotransferase [Clostridia bacterium]|nr:phosphotransferase [Clostridia bacterium]